MIPPVWRRSTRCNTAACVEVATDEWVHVRDSKETASPVLTFGPAAWQVFVDGLRDGTLPGGDQRG